MMKRSGLAMMALLASSALAAPAWAGSGSATAGYGISIPAMRFDFGGRVWWKCAVGCNNYVSSYGGGYVPAGALGGGYGGHAGSGAFVYGPGAAGGGHGGPPLGPWYLYWPAAGYLQPPTIPQYPFWPQQPPANNNGVATGGGVAPVGYAPNYWYGQ